ncbi:hypothetical protein CEXT_548031 [Caerostris extrusa]|uniref:Uncharacterized protein n=1 Tax=Caerostris extrusa TaxID=172846 RepID=A0AAV4NXR2_CAEEX|nr:hypothetical protein CEXT_548031 [Caerostris extrusa]
MKLFCRSYISVIAERKERETTGVGGPLFFSGCKYFLCYPPPSPPQHIRLKRALETNRASSGLLNKVGSPVRYSTKIEFHTGATLKAISALLPPTIPSPFSPSSPSSSSSSSWGVFLSPPPHGTPVPYLKFNFRLTVNTEYAYSGRRRAEDQ